MLLLSGKTNDAIGAAAAVVTRIRTRTNQRIDPLDAIEKWMSEDENSLEPPA